MGISVDMNTYNASSIASSKQPSVYTTGNNGKSDISKNISSSVFATNNSNIYHKSNCPELNTKDLIPESCTRSHKKGWNNWATPL